MDDTQIQEETKGKSKEKTTKKGIKKEDWERAKEQYAAMLVNALVNISGYKYMVDVCDKCIASYEDEEEEMPDDIKDMLK